MKKEMTRKGEATVMLLTIIAVIIGVGLIVLMMWGLPKYRIYRLDFKGQSTLREAEWTKKVLIEDARARRDAATLLAAAEVERAKGVAQANKIIGESLKQNESYLRYLWIQGLHDGSSEIIYVPTEANLPILEAGKR